uniref:Uncharacterized protein n=1 Tax=uncultured Thiotrichaceae bacterium TaxID=298394 RepID=A0A6S6S465_9GAMM|nr:MAG: Unknown protein [uncultured Thiotrichaceae bacterium]
MIIKPSDFPGSHERHLLRKANNPLFEERQIELDDEALMNAQGLDHDLLVAFMTEFRELLHQTTNLSGNVESDTVLGIKDRLDRAYETASAVADDQTHARQAISKLLGTLMVAVRQGAGDDAHAQQELDQEDSARDAHFQLMESQLVADLLNPDSVITAEELVATLLSSDKDDILLAVQLFDISQLEVLIGQGVQLLERLPEPHAGSKAESEQKLVLIQGYIEFLNTQSID